MLELISAHANVRAFEARFEWVGLGIGSSGGLRNDLPAANGMLQPPAGCLPVLRRVRRLVAEKPSQRPRLPLEAVLRQTRARRS